MKIVIDISKELFDIAKDGMLNEIQSMFICGSVSQGTPLPKGHGRLIDADALYDEYAKEPEEFNGGHSLMALFRVAPTIIEADRSEREKA